MTGMTSSLDARIEEGVAALGDLTRGDLTACWIKAYRCAPPKGVKRGLLERAAARHLQARHFGGLSPMARKAIRDAVKLGANSGTGVLEEPRDTKAQRHATRRDLSAVPEVDSNVEKRLIQILRDKALLADWVQELHPNSNLATALTRAALLIARLEPDAAEARRDLIRTLVRRVTLTPGSITIDVDRSALVAELAPEHDQAKQSERGATIGIGAQSR